MSIARRWFAAGACALAIATAEHSLRVCKIPPTGENEQLCSGGGGGSGCSFSVSASVSDSAGVSVSGGGGSTLMRERVTF